MAQSNLDIKISLATSFLESFEDLPKSIQKKTREFLTKFQENPLASSINYETINNSSNEDLRSVRIDQAYRGIVLKPKSGNIYYLLWVARHDDAYDWALSKRIDSKEIIGADYLDTKFKTVTVNEEKKSILRNTGIVDLVKIGIPLELIDLIREVNDINDLDVYKDSLEVKTYLKLQYYLNGYKLENLNDFVENREEKTNPFIMVDDLSDSELLSLINSPLNKWRLFLHPNQLKLTNMNFSGSVKVIGSAGTGKTVVAIHRSKYLLRNIKNDERLLFTTFTKTLSEDLKLKVNEIIQKADKNKVDIANIDSVVYQFIRSNRLNMSIIDDTDDIWYKAKKAFSNHDKYSISFLKDEWEMVILANNINNLEEYMVIPREFRVKKIDRQSRIEVWNIIENYLKEMKKLEMFDTEWAKLEVIRHLEKKHPNGIYRYIVLDEAQDMSNLSFKLIRALAGKEKPNDIFIVGDSRQRIYKNRTTLKACGINVIGNSYILNINYRTTDSIYDFASDILDGFEFDDLNGEIIKDENVQSVIIGNTPQVTQFETIESEVDYIANYINNLIESKSNLNEICVCLRTNELAEKYSNELIRRKIKTLKLSINQSDNPDIDGIRITTMHRVKGLEFSHIILAGLNKDVMPLESLLSNVDSEIEKSRVIQTEKSLLYVAMTRARYSLLITSSDQISEFIKF